MTGELPLPERLRWRQRPDRTPIMYQTWLDLLFAHWEVPAAYIQSTLPPGLTVDTWNGRAFVGLIPFFMRRVRPKAFPPLPWISNFLEMNVRTYVVDEHGVPGVWFYSLDCNQPFAVWAARALMALPYEHATMKAPRRVDGTIDYESKRRGAAAKGRFAYRLGAERTRAEPGTLEFFLVERYILFTVLRGRLCRGHVHHHPYPLSSVTVECLEAGNFTPAAVAWRSPASHLIASAGVAVEIFAPQPASAV